MNERATWLKQRFTDVYRIAPSFHICSCMILRLPFLTTICKGVNKLYHSLRCSYKVNFLLHVWPPQTHSGCILHIYKHTHTLSQSVRVAQKHSAEVCVRQLFSIRVMYMGMSAARFFHGVRLCALPQSLVPAKACSHFQHITLNMQPLPIAIRWNIWKSLKSQWKTVR